MSDNEGSSTVCPFCAVGCRLGSGDTDPTRVRGVRGRSNPDGRLCRKGIRSASAFASADRLTSPLVRRDGDLVEASWDAALDRAAGALDAVRSDHGADALAFFGAPRCTNEENYLLQKLARTLGTNNVDNRARSCHRSAMTAVETRLGWPAMTNLLSDLGRADAILVVGANPAVQQPIAFDSHIRPAVNGGTSLIHVDPRRTETTRIATHHLAPRPGTDAALVSLLTADLVDRGAVDREFIDARTTGFDRYADGLRDRNRRALLAETDVAAATVDSVVDVLASVDRMAVVAGTGIEEAGDRTHTADALVNLLLATGNLGRRGTGLNVFRGLNNEQGAVDVGCRPDRLPGHAPVTDARARESVASVWDVDLPATPGLEERSAVDAFGADVRGVLAVGENPAVEKREAAWLRDRFEAVDTLVVIDVFPTETTSYADVVLPATAGLEKRGTVTSLDRLVQPLTPVVEAPSGTRPDFEIIQALGERLVDGFAFDDPAEAFAELQLVCQPYDGLDVEQQGARWPADGADVLYTDGFRTADGRAEFVAVEHSRRPETRQGLQLVVTSRIGGFAAGDTHDGRLHVHPADAEARGITDGDRVIVRSATDQVVTTADVDNAVRRETVTLDAKTADAIVRDTATMVHLEPVNGV